MRRERVIENQPSAPLDLNAAEVGTLERLGRALASDKRWWGAALESEGSRSAIELQQSPAGTTLTIRNAVGVVGTGQRTIVVEPKIPRAHFLYLAQRGGLAARSEIPKTSIGIGQDIWSIVAAWFCSAVRQLIRRDLIRDYRVLIDELPVVRGRIHILATTRALNQGRLAITCEYSEFDQDTPFNRVLRAATHHLIGSASVTQDLRRGARRLAPVFDGVGALQRDDLDATIDRRTAHYRDAFELARLIVASRDLDIQGGIRAGHTALIRTPELAENGIRTILSQVLGPDIAVTKRGVTLSPTTLTLTPDLVFDGGQAIGDVKYQIVGHTWSRNHLYQAITFAAGYKCGAAIVVGFGANPPPPDVSVGAIRLSAAIWPINRDLPPDDAAGQLTSQVQAWYEASRTAVARAGS